MKPNLTCFLLLLAATSSFAAITGYDMPQPAICNTSGREPVACDLLMSTLFPTTIPSLFIESEEINMNSPEAVERLRAEAQGDADPILLDHIATQAHVSEDVARKSAVELLSKHEVLTPGSLYGKLTSK